MLARLAPLALVLVALAGCSDGDKGGDASDATTTTGAPTTGATSGLSGSVTSADTPTTEPTTDATITGDATGGGSGGATGGAIDGAFCQEECQVDADCTAMGVELDLTCEAGRCTGVTQACTSDDSCRTLYSGWVTPCTDQLGCPGQVCVDVGGGEGRCATPPSMFLMCETLMQSEISMPAIEGDMQLTVCANTNYLCDSGTCLDPCEDDLGCALIPGHPRCNADLGTCECTTDLHCQSSGIAGYARCNAGVCGCGSDADCTGVPNADICNESGFCGCSSAAACTVQSFDGTTPVCEPA